MLQNVISNAIKYRRDGVTPRIVIAAEKGEAIIEVRVADNGVGLSDEELDRIFGLFERGASDQPGHRDGARGRAADARAPRRHDPRALPRPRPGVRVHGARAAQRRLTASSAAACAAASKPAPFSR